VATIYKHQSVTRDTRVTHTDTPGRDGRMDDNQQIGRERAWRRAVLAGDEDAWHTLYQSHFAALYAYVHLRAGKRADVTDELVQDVWMHAVRRIADFDPARGPFAAWLRGIALNVLRNYYRRRAMLPLDEQTSPAAAPAATAENAEEVTLALVELPGDYRRVLEDQYQQEHSVQEIADRWNRSPKSIESLLSRARAAFSAAFLRITQGPPRP
jgi:RNA polymerase sigma-70 factor, ECF subfamily